MRELMALVLAGGGGERLSVLSVERAVSALPFGGKYRIIDFVLSNCCHSGIERVGVLTQHLPTSLHDHIGSGRAWDLDGREGGVLILQPYLTRDRAGWYRGTADALAQNLDTLEAAGLQRVLVLSGDHIYKMDYRLLLQAHAAHDAAVTVAVTAVDPKQSRRFGMATLDADGRVQKLEEKPAVTEASLANMGVYVFEAEVLREALRAHPVDLVIDVLRPLIAAGERVFGFEFAGYWEDVGTVAAYYGASLDLLDPGARSLLHDPRWPILTRDEERPPVLTLPGAHLEDCLIANGSRIAGRVENSVLSSGVIVHVGAVVKDSVVMSDTVIGIGARVERAILDKYVRVGEGAVVGGGETRPDPDLDWLDGLTLVGKDAVLPDRVRIGAQVVVGVGAVPGDFAGGSVPAGVRIADRPAMRGLV